MFLFIEMPANEKNVFKFGTFELSKGFLYGDFNALPSSECLFFFIRKGMKPVIIQVQK